MKSCGMSVRSVREYWFSPSGPLPPLFEVGVGTLSWIVPDLDGRKRILVLDAALDVDQPLLEGVVPLAV